MWAKLDDEIFDNPKILAAGALATLLHIAAIVWSCRNLTDGFIPQAKVDTLVNWEGVAEDAGIPADAGEAFISANRITSFGLVEQLTALALWHEVPGGYLLHDFDKYQKSKAEVLAERERRKTNQKTYRERRTRDRGVTDSVTDNVIGALSVRDHGPVPVPVPRSGSERSESLLFIAPVSSPARSATRAKPKTSWPPDLTLTPERAAYASRQNLEAAYEWGKFKAHAERDDVRHVNWDAAWRYWVRNAWELEARRARR